jgi:hypothetical protein
MEKILEFKDIQELIKSKIWEDRNVESTKTHFDKNNKKFITKVEYGEEKTG